MLTALFIVLGIDLIVAIILTGTSVARRRWLKGQPGEFSGAIQVVSGEVHGLQMKWKRGSGRWVRDVLVWSKGPLLFRNEILPVDRMVGQRPLEAGEVKRIGDDTVSVRFESEDAVVEIAVASERFPLVLGPFGPTVTTDPSVEA